MKKLTFTLHATWIAAILLCTLSIHGMDKPIQEASCLPNEVINHIAGYCKPTEKDLLMKVCQSFYKRLQDKESIMLANPSKVTLSHKIKKMFEYTRSGDAKKLSIWLSVLEAADVNQDR